MNVTMLHLRCKRFALTVQRIDASPSGRRKYAQKVPGCGIMDITIFQLFRKQPRLADIWLETQQ